MSDELHRLALTVLQPGFEGLTPPDWVRRHLADGLGAVGLFGRNIRTPEQVAALTAALRKEKDDVLVAIDEEGGDVTRLEVNEGSSWPGNLALGTVDDVGLTRAVATGLGRDLARCGVDFNWAPDADVNSNQDNPVIGVRSFGSDPHLVARHTVAYVEGLQSTGVVACVKHFPGHGDTSVDSHLGLPRVDASRELLAERELVPFRAAIAAGAKAVMSAHMVLPAYDAEYPATLSRAILTGLLREELGFQGLIVTDGIEMGAIADTYGVADGSVRALAAGADAVCIGGGLCDEATLLMIRDAIVTAVREGRLSAERLADAAARVAALASWTRAAAAAGSGAPGPDGGLAAPGDHAPGLDAARRAVRVEGVLRPVESAAHVLELTSQANIAVGDATPWGVGAYLAEALPGTTVARAGVTTFGLVDTQLAAAAGRPFVVVVRDLHRNVAAADLLAGLVAARPDTVVVEMGLPYGDAQGLTRISTHGAARVCGIAAAETLTGRTLR
ncbi:glycoside hydrolase family 3 protein [Yinghuangia soli]|uniref:Glycoside hydrolase family 3 protein n=1 Tax=Yinghuangia soli TaxID=2908204 RepID=A0AA41Q3V4_9ACTN|nr:glycoside hydrolase family 3 N-terminal domain-containing protein [Yinghuangia soli]MCF2529944.1 glycoside hydrolase family 3 protein [Yinghuangia soli]